MLSIFLLIIVLISLWQGRRLVVDECYKELKVFVFLQIIALAYGLVVILDIWEISPFQFIIDVMKNLDIIQPFKL